MSRVSGGGVYFQTPLAHSANRNFRFDFRLNSTVLLTCSAYNARSADFFLFVGNHRSLLQRGHFRAYLLQNRRRQRGVTLRLRDFLPGRVHPT